MKISSFPKRKTIILILLISLTIYYIGIFLVTLSSKEQNIEITNNNLISYKAEPGKIIRISSIILKEEEIIENQVQYLIHKSNSNILERMEFLASDVLKSDLTITSAMCYIDNDNLEISKEKLEDKYFAYYLKNFDLTSYSSSDIEIKFNMVFNQKKIIDTIIDPGIMIGIFPDPPLPIIQVVKIWSENKSWEPQIDYSKPDMQNIQCDGYYTTLKNYDKFVFHYELKWEYTKEPIKDIEFSFHKAPPSKLDQTIYLRDNQILDFEENYLVSCEKTAKEFLIELSEPGQILIGEPKLFLILENLDEYKEFLVLEDISNQTNDELPPHFYKKTILNETQHATISINGNLMDPFTTFLEVKRKVKWPTAFSNQNDYIDITLYMRPASSLRSKTTTTIWAIPGYVFIDWNSAIQPLNASGIPSNLAIFEVDFTDPPENNKIILRMKDENIIDQEKKDEFIIKFYLVVGALILFLFWIVIYSNIFVSQLIMTISTSGIFTLFITFVTLFFNVSNAYKNGFICIILFYLFLFIIAFLLIYESEESNGESDNGEDESEESNGESDNGEDESEESNGESDNGEDESEESNGESDNGEDESEEC